MKPWWLQKAIAYIDSVLENRTYEEGELPYHVVKAKLYSNRWLQECLSTIRKRIPCMSWIMLTEFGTNVWNTDPVCWQVRVGRTDWVIPTDGLLCIRIIIFIVILIGWGFLSYIKRLKKMHRSWLLQTKKWRSRALKWPKARKMKTAFLHSICHEVRTPLNSINGILAVVTGRVFGSDTKRNVRIAYKRVLMRSLHWLLTCLNYQNCQFGWWLACPTCGYSRALCRRSRKDKRKNNELWQNVLLGIMNILEIPTNSFCLSVLCVC